MRLSLLILVLGGIFLVLAGLRPQSLPFVPEARFSDAALSHWPAALHLREAVLGQGEFPFWQQTILAGQPFAANPLNKTAYPLQWLALLLPAAVHLNTLIVVHLLLAGWGMWRWARRVELSASAALLCGLAYVFSAKTLGHIGAGHVDLLYALTWWPWLMLSVRQMTRPEQTGSPLLHSLLIGIFAALTVLADVRLGLFALALAAAYGLWQVAQAQAWRRLAGGLLSGGVLVLLTLSVTVPLLGWRPYLSRADMTAADAGVFSLEGGHLIGLLLPPHSGNPETVVYVGLPVLLLAGVAVASAPRRHAFWTVVLVLAILYALGINSPLWVALVDLLPFLRWFRVPSRAWFVVVLVSSLLSGYGLQTLMHTVQRLRQGDPIHRLAVKRLMIAGAMGAALFCGGFTLAMLTDLPVTIGAGVIGVGLLLGVVLLLAFYGRLTPEQMAAALTMILFADLAWTGWQWLEWRGPDQWRTHQAALVEVLLEENPARIYSPNYALEQQVAAAHDLSLFYGVDPFQLTGIVQAVEQGSGVPVTEYTVVLPPLDLEPEEGDERDPEALLLAANQGAVPDTEVLAQWHVSHVIATYPMLHERLALRAEVDQVFIYENLDYDAPPALDAYGWPQEGWAGLPDAGIVESLNQQTAAAALVSMVSFILCLSLAGWRMLRR